MKIDKATKQRLLTVDQAANYLGVTPGSLTLACFEYALNGSFSHLREITERIDGKIPDVRQPTEEYEYRNMDEMRQNVKDKLERFFAHIDENGELIPEGAQLGT